MKKREITRPMDQDNKKKRSYSRPELTPRDKLKNITAGIPSAS